jgi:hypothetical protein
MCLRADIFRPLFTSAMVEQAHSEHLVAAPRCDRKYGSLWQTARLPLHDMRRSAAKWCLKSFNSIIRTLNWKKFTFEFQ